MKYNLIPALLITMQLFFSCTTEQQKETEPVITPKTEPAKVASKPDYSGVTFGSKKDLVCGMPVRVGVTDTAHYKNKIYGFCASECKQEFVNNPALYLAVK